MIKQSLQLSALTLVGLLTTLLKIRYSLAFAKKTLSISVADIYRRISLLTTKIQTYVTNDNRLLKIDKEALNGRDTTAANIGFASGGVTCFY